MARTRLSLLATLSATAVLLTACGGGADEPEPTDAVETDTQDTADDADQTADAGEDTADAGACSPDSLETVTAGTLTLSTSEPAFEPWMVDDDPANGEGFESAVAYAVAEQLGFEADTVEWVRNPFEATISPGPKNFDLAINQFSITEERRQAVDFTSGYYDVRQAVVSKEGAGAADATSLADLKDSLLGAQVGTTSLASIEESIAPTQDPLIFNSNEEAKLALDNNQVDAIVVDLPTAFYLTAVEIEGGVIVGQLPLTGDTEQLGFVLDLGSPLTDCATQAVDALREDGTLDDLATEWLADVAGAPELQ
ncbi:transporter substrate-binding domain-containing protein [Ornithinimicrobium sp. F0845]|uniref:ABC transporter substrate-binding protein n=1 Tax=Ornithinimicrobium sp. F0845 TaxID=2926412 RepID=UPI001FF4FE1B|nr:transporter substrate-binding domain-containing protein [Ornithinimicrobium sp. F0845]MCK0110688.1 transporter substrate-binding domain-containing protein [Ornithinimicrobium sp. F0845]